MGPSLQSVLHLSTDPPLVDSYKVGAPSSDSGKLRAPPLQRPTKSFYARPHPASAEDCLEAHLAQIQTRQEERVRQHKEDSNFHKDQIDDLRARVAHSFEEEASRRSWHQQIAKDQTVQLAEKQANELASYKDAHTPLEYWPFEVDKPGMVLPDKKVYGAELLLAAQQKANAKALQRAMMRRAGPPTLRLGAERQREQARLEAQTVGKVPPHEVKAALAEADRMRREAVASQAMERLPPSDPNQPAERQRGREAFAVGEKFVTSALGKFQLREAQKVIREQVNKQQLRDVLIKQAADKRQREAKDHYYTYGAPPDITNGTLNRQLTHAAIGGTSREMQIAKGAARRAELEEAIVIKQKERRELRRVAQEAQSKLDQEAATAEVLSYEIDRLRQAEVRTAMQIEMAKVASKSRRQKESLHPSRLSKTN